MTPAHGARVLVVAILASFVAFLDGSIVNVALPAIERELGGGVVTQQWVLDGYLLTLGSLILLAGALSDSFGRVRVLAAGLVVFGVASVACAVAPTAGVLIGARAVQGMGAALLVPSSLALITSTFSGAEQSRAIGRWTAWTSLSSIAGPLLGGLLADTIGWRWMFGINIAPIVATLVALVPLRGARPARAARVDLLGALLGGLGLAGPVFALIEQARLGWTHPAVLVPLIGGLACLAAFLWWEGRSSAPMLPLSLFRARNFAFGNLATLFVYAGLSLGPLVLVLFLQEAAGWSATLAGLTALPTALLLLALSGFFGGLAGRFGPRLFMTAGPLLIAAGCAWMLLVGEPVAFWTQILPGLVLWGVGLAITVAPLTAAVLGAIAPERSGIASAVNNAVARVAGLLAVACLGLVVGGAGGAQALHRGVLVTGALMLAGALVSFIGIRRPAAAG